ncbi:uncharacterized protein LOC118194647 [Stegodyphus dumicola]|uniref:uncharacterized protein LOC118194647 n=1 Tax=Stegodyphus dumicola TaxID=202533 RepID=UPI0015AC7481|nr:uncharacterized protein LOC118194647 [Stegodyphus dumicola]
MSGTDHYKNTSKSPMLSTEFITEDVSSKNIVYNAYDAVPFSLESDEFMSYDKMPNSEFSSQFIPNDISKESDNLSVTESPVPDLIKMKNLISKNEGSVNEISKQDQDCIDLKSSLNRKFSCIKESDRNYPSIEQQNETFEEYLGISKQIEDCIDYKSSLNNTFDFVKESNRNSSIKQDDKSSEEYLNILKEGQDFINFKPSLNSTWALVKVSNKITSVDQKNEKSECFSKKSMFCNPPTNSENEACFKADFFLPIKEENISYNKNLSPSVPLIGDDSNSSELNCLQSDAQVNILNPMLNAFSDTYSFLDGETLPNSNERAFQHSSSTSAGTETFENNSEGNYEINEENYSEFGRSVSSYFTFPENKNYSKIVFQLQDNSTYESRNMNWFEKPLYAERSNAKNLIPIPYGFSSVCNGDFCSNSATKIEWEDISNNVEVCEDTKNYVEEYDNSGILMEENNGINTYIEEYVDPVLFNNTYRPLHPEMNSCRAFPNMFKIPSDSIPYLPKEETSFNLNHIESSDFCYENVNGM